MTVDALCGIEVEKNELQGSIKEILFLLISISVAFEMKTEEFVKEG